MVRHYLLKNRGKEAKIGHWPVIVPAILFEEGFLQYGETWANLKCEGKEPSVSDKLIIDLDVIGVIRTSVQTFTRLVSIGSKSEDIYGAHKTRQRTSLVVT